MPAADEQTVISTGSCSPDRMFGRRPVSLATCLAPDSGVSGLLEVRDSIVQRTGDLQASACSMQDAERLSRSADGALVSRGRGACPIENSSVNRNESSIAFAFASPRWSVVDSEKKMLQFENTLFCVRYVCKLKRTTLETYALPLIIIDWPAVVQPSTAYETPNPDVSLLVRCLIALMANKDSFLRKS